MFVQLCNSRKQILLRREKIALRVSCTDLLKPFLFFFFAGVVSDKSLCLMTKCKCASASHMLWKKPKQPSIYFKLCANKSKKRREFQVLNVLWLHKNTLNKNKKNVLGRRLMEFIVLKHKRKQNWVVLVM